MNASGWAPKKAKGNGKKGKAKERRKRYTTREWVEEFLPLD